MLYRAPRFACRHAASLRVAVGAESVAVVLVNISAEGAGISGAPALPRGAVVLLTVPPLHTLRAVVQWAEGGQAGVRFAVPLGARTLATLRRGALVGQVVGPEVGPVEMRTGIRTGVNGGDQAGRRG